MFLLTAASPPQALSVNDMGRTAAGLSDWQTMAFFLMGVIALLLTDRAVTAWQNRATFGQLASAIEKLAEAVTFKTTDTNVNLEMIRHDIANIRTKLS
ncbi:hypothetical protein [Sphingomonas sp.]|jgi:hypothetical protein|uniref:hypothetical protein n=1 Tax=Sphingomonas sp. TaxID=28214 RepID=UPI002D7E997A|nr:hypothetical protein [Sphingomonas sp.]HEU0045069.1 hypothetical protein [Sphingomonas sp.]